MRAEPLLRCATLRIKEGLAQRGEGSLEWSWVGNVSSHPLSGTQRIGNTQWCLWAQHSRWWAFAWVFPPISPGSPWGILHLSSLLLTQGLAMVGTPMSWDPAGSQGLALPLTLATSLPTLHLLACSLITSWSHWPFHSSETSNSFLTWPTSPNAAPSA